MQTYPFVLAIPNAVAHVLAHVFAIVAGMLVTTGALYLVRQSVKESFVKVTMVKDATEA